MPRSYASRTLTLSSCALFGCCFLLSGCGIDAIDHSATGSAALHGMVHGGQQPVSGAIIQLYTVGGSGNGSLATAMLTTPVLSRADGTFDITGAYTCGKSSLGAAINSPSNQVYIVATGGNPGLTPAADNPALVLVTALGDCASLPSASYVEINEITTAAAAWALSPFTASATNVGASATNVSGIRNAFLDAALLADSSTGLPAAIASNLTVETPKLVSLANALAGCVNSNGATGCTPLFTAATPTGSLVPPTNTLAAALNIVKNPGQNVQAVFNAIGSTPPFAGGLTTSPSDWTMSLSMTGGGLTEPEALAIDAEGNAWVANLNGPLSAFNPQGTPLSPTGYGATVVKNAYALTIDTLDNVWVAANNAPPYRAAGAVIKFRGGNSSTPGALVQNGSSPYFYDASIQYPYAVASDTNGNIFIANYATGTATVYTSAGSLYTDPAGHPSAGLGGTSGESSFPVGIAVDASHGFWLPSGDNLIAHYDANGTLLSDTICCSLGEGVATDSFGDVWIANLSGNSVSEVAPDGTLLIGKAVIGGLDAPQVVAVDAAQNVWLANYKGASFSEVAANHTTAPGRAISPLTGYGLDAALDEPVSVAPDRSGNLWVANQTSNNVVMFFGVATPTSTPVLPSPTAP